MPTKPPVATVSPSRISFTASAAETTLPFSSRLRNGRAGCSSTLPPCSTSVPRGRCAPSPLAGEGWGGGWLLHEMRQQQRPPPLTPPHKGEGNRPTVLH